MLKQNLQQSLLDAEIVAKTFSIPPFDLYLMGGSGCIIAGYIDRATIDFDFIDLNYNSKLSRVFKMLAPFDMIDYNMATIAPNYKKRAKRQHEFKYLGVYVLSPEDIIVTKIGRYSERDKQDIKKLLQISNETMINDIIEEVYSKAEFGAKSKKIFKEKVVIFRGDFHV